MKFAFVYCRIPCNTPSALLEVAAIWRALGHAEVPASTVPNILIRPQPMRQLYTFYLQIVPRKVLTAPNPAVEMLRGTPLSQTDMDSPKDAYKGSHPYKNCLHGFHVGLVKGAEKDKSVSKTTSAISNS